MDVEAAQYNCALVETLIAVEFDEEYASMDKEFCLAVGSLSFLRICHIKALVFAKVLSDVEMGDEVLGAKFEGQSVGGMETDAALFDID